MNSNEIRNLVQRNFELNLNQKKRTKKLVHARAVYFKLCRDCTDLTFAKIGNTLGFSHGNVIHSINKIFPSFDMYNNDYITIYNEIKMQDSKAPLSKRFEAAKNENSNLKREIEKLKRKINKHETETIY